MLQPLALFAAVSLLAAPAAKPPQPEEIDATSLLAGAREVDADGQIKADTVLMFDGIAAEGNAWEPNRSSDTVSFVIQLAEPFDLHRAVAVNSFNEKGYPGISTKKMKIEHGTSAAGPFKPLVELNLKKGTAPQKFEFTPVKGVRFLRIHVLENHGNREWWGLAELSVFGRRSQPREKIDFTGAWQTPYGEMKLEQKGERITGCYGDGGNALEGTAEGPVFFGTYDEAGAKGGMAFALTAEGDLAGVWGADVTGKDRNGRWDGSRIKSSTLVCRPPEKDLAKELKEKGRVVLRGILFDTGKDVIRSESLPVLQALAGAMKAEKETRYVIEGHTDDRGGEAYNQTLSEKRAASVKKWLTGQGIAEARLVTRGYGQSKPAMSNDSEAGRAANRRVEVAIAD
ncbi:MAG: OmpA family protein [Myxococcales bacterium]